MSGPMTVRGLSELADAAYGLGVSSDDPEVRGFARGVEDLARYLAHGGAASPALAALLNEVDAEDGTPMVAGG